MRFVDETISYLRDMLWYPRGSPALPKPCWRLLGLAAFGDAVALILVRWLEPNEPESLAGVLLIMVGFTGCLLAVSASMIELVRSALRARPERAPIGLRIYFHQLALFAAFIGLLFGMVFSALADKSGG